MAPYHGFSPLGRRSWGPAMLLVLWLGLAQLSSAQVLRCTDPRSGQVSYTDGECPQGSAAREIAPKRSAEDLERERSQAAQAQAQLERQRDRDAATARAAAEVEAERLRLQTLRESQAARAVAPPPVVVVPPPVVVAPLAGHGRPRPPVAPFGVPIDNGPAGSTWKGLQMPPPPPPRLEAPVRATSPAPARPCRPDSGQAC